MAEKSVPKKKVGRPKGEPSTIVNIRLPLTLVARLDRHVDWVEVHSGVSTNRGTLTRRALQMFLDMHEIPIILENHCTTMISYEV